MQTRAQQGWMPEPGSQWRLKTTWRAWRRLMLYPTRHRKQIAGKDIDGTLLDPEQTLSDGLGTKPLTFTFVPTVRRLPSRFLIVEPSEFTFKPAEEPKRDRCGEIANKSTVDFETLRGRGANQAAAMQDSPSHKVINKQEILQEKERTVSESKEMQKNDVYQAEFVLITDSDGDDESSTRGNKKQPTVIAVITDHRQERVQSLTAPWDSTGRTGPAELTVGIQDAPKAQHSERCQQNQPQLMSSFSNTDHLSHKAPDIHIAPPTNQKLEHNLANLNQVSSEETYSKSQSSSRPSKQDSSEFFKTTGHSPSCSINSESKTLKSRSSTLNTPSDTKLPIKIQMKAYTIPNSFYTVHKQAEVGSRKNQIPSSHFSSESEISNLRVQSPTSYPSVRSSTLSPISIKVTTHSLCPSPKPMEPHFYGSCSTICSSNEPFSPVLSNTDLSRSGVKSPLPARLSFLTTVLKSGKSTDHRTLSPEPSSSNFSSKSPQSPSQSPDQISKLYPYPAISKKSSSRFTIGASNQKDYLNSLFSDQSPYQYKIVPSQSELNIVNHSFHAISPSPTKWHRALSPSRESRRPPSRSSSREKVMSPALLQTCSSKTPSPTPGYASSLHHKPPLNKETKHSLKKIPVPVKSRKVPVFSPAVSPTNQRVTVSPTPEIGLSPPKLFQSTPFQTKQAKSPLHTEELNVSSPSQTDDRYSLLMTYNIHSSSPYLTSLSPYPNYRPYSASPRPEKSPTAFLAQCTSPISMHSPSSHSALSRSSDLSSAQSFSQSPDHETKKPKEYKIKSRYKALAAIPTNTLLLEQKALDEPVKTPDIAEEDKLETHSELCSPAQLRQQTEEVCAAIDKVLQEPLPMHHHDLGQVSSQSLDVPKMPMTLSKVTGRETRYAVLCPPVPATTEGQWTKPGVIRPVPVKAKIILKKEEGCRPNPFKKYAEGTSGREMQHLLHSTSRANKSDLRQHDRNGKTSKGACQKNEQTPYSGQLLLIREDLENTAAKHSKGKK